MEAEMQKIRLARLSKDRWNPSFMYTHPMFRWPVGVGYLLKTRWGLLEVGEQGGGIAMFVCY
jgi:hypothetical protein